MGQLLHSPNRIVFDFEPAGTVVYLGGSLTGASLQHLVCAMDAVLRNQGRRFIVDVSEVDEWSLIAQAVVLATARRKEAHGQQLVLRGASPLLRAQSQQLGLFERLRSIDARVPSA
jgi:anti-anti-sigma regulatory factor